jgi:rhomboid protease GluP
MNNLLLALFVVSHSLIISFKIIYQKLWVMKDWLYLAVFNLSCLIICWFINEDLAGYIAGGIWIVFTLIPILCLRLAGRLVLKSRWKEAYWISVIAVVLHPAKRIKDSPLVYKFYAACQSGEFDQAEKLVNLAKAKNPEAAKPIDLHFKRSLQQWEQISESIHQFTKAELVNIPALLMLYLRMLGETGNRQEMLQKTVEYEKDLIVAQSTSIAWMICFAMYGAIADLQLLFSGQLRALSEPIKEFWLATAMLINNDKENAERILNRLQSSDDKLLKLAVQRRIKFPLNNNPISAEEKELLTTIRNHALEDSQFNYGKNHLTPISTYLIIVLCLFGYGVQIYNGATSELGPIVKVGALYTFGIRNGEWWRLLSAQFLHFGVVHLLMNIIAFLVLAPYAERSLGSLRFAILYLLAGTGSLLVYISISILGYIPEDVILVGASGGVMATVGMSGAILLQGWKKSGSKIAKDRSKSILFIVICQAVVDSMVPNVSFTVHLAGAVLGFVLCYLLLIKSRVQSL